MPPRPALIAALSAVPLLLGRAGHAKPSLGAATRSGPECDSLVAAISMDHPPKHFHNATPLNKVALPDSPADIGRKPVVITWRVTQTGQATLTSIDIPPTHDEGFRARLEAAAAGFTFRPADVDGCPVTVDFLLAIKRQ